MAWTAPTRNFTGVQFADLRKTIDEKFNSFHDALSEHYYSERDLPLLKKSKFLYGGHDYGRLTEKRFNRLHGLCFNLQQLALMDGNASLTKQYDLAEIDPEITGATVTVDGVTRAMRRSDELRSAVDALKTLGIEVVL